MRSRVQIYGRENTIGPRVHIVVIPGVSVGGPKDLDENVLPVLFEAEERGLHIVLHATQLTDLDSQVAQVCRRVYTSDAMIGREATYRWGVEQVIIGGPGSASMVTELRTLPIPASRTFVRRTYNLVRQLRRTV